MITLTATIGYHGTAYKPHPHSHIIKENRLCFTIALTADQQTALGVTKKNIECVAYPQKGVSTINQLYRGAIVEIEGNPQPQKQSGLYFEVKKLTIITPAAKPKLPPFLKKQYQAARKL